MNLPRVLMIDDDHRFCMAMSKALKRRGFEVDVVHESEAAIEALSSSGLDTVAVLDLKMPHRSGLELLKLTMRREAPVIMLTGHGAVPEAVEAMKAGAYTFLTKPIDAVDLEPMLIQAHQYANEGELSPPFIGESESACQVRSMIEYLADSEEVVLIVGETGTGKEVVARALHEKSARSDHPFISVNLSALSSSQLDDHLFRAARDQASGKAPSIIEQVGQGTLFMDDVKCLSVLHQAKLLELIKTRCAQSQQGMRTEFRGRIIVTAKEDLIPLVNASLFREDLYYCLAALPIHLLPLSSREGDAALIFDSWLSRLSGRSYHLSDPAITLLNSYAWPGNVRELVNLARRAAVKLDMQAQELQESNEIDDAWLTPLLSHTPFEQNSSRESLLEAKGLISTSDALIGQDLSLEEVEKAHIMSLIDRHGNLSHVARILQINRRTLQRKLKIWGESLD